MVAPAIESGVIPETGMEAVVHVTVPVVAAIDAGVVVAVAEVGTRIIGMAAAIEVGTLHVSAMRADVHHARSVVHTHNRATAVQTIANVHAAAVDRSNLSVRTDARGTTTPQRNVPGSCRSMTARVATRRGVSAIGRVSTLRGVTALRRVATFGGVSALRRVPTFGGVSALRRVPTLRGVSALRRVPTLRGVSALGGVPASAALCRGRVGRRLARTGFFLLLLRRPASRGHRGHSEKNQQ